MVVAQYPLLGGVAGRVSLGRMMIFRLDYGDGCTTVDILKIKKKKHLSLN